MASIAALALLITSATAWAGGFHGGGGGGFHGGFGGGGGFGGYHGGGFGGGGFGGYGGYHGGGDFGGYHPSFNTFGGYGGYHPSDFGGLSGLSNYHPYNFGGDSFARPETHSFNNFGGGGFDHGGIPSLGHDFNFNRSVTGDQLRNFLNLPQTGGGAARIGGDSFKPAWSNGYAGKAASWSRPNSIGNLNDRFQNAIRPNANNNVHNWLDNHPNRVNNWNNLGNNVRNNWDHNHHDQNWWNHNGVRPGSDWWSKYHPNLDHWYYHHAWWNHPWNYWWGFPTWVSLGNWFPLWGWSTPIYYDYGDGGNVVYQDNNVYVNGQDVGTAQQYAQSATELATVDPSQVENQQNDDWLPLGTFALTTGKDDTNAARVIQLAVDKQGIISGTLHNSSSDQTLVVQGRVDKNTQRVAFTIGDKNDVVFETGIYNLTQKETPILVHFGPDRTETDYLVRLTAPADGSSSTGSPAPAAPPETLPGDGSAPQSN